jgi:hypothetical protein
MGGAGPWVVRGGSWNNESTNARTAYRNNDQPDNTNNNLGLRLVAPHAPPLPTGNVARCMALGGRGSERWRAVAPAGGPRCPPGEYRTGPRPPVGSGKIEQEREKCIRNVSDAYAAGMPVESEYWTGETGELEPF